MTEATGSTPSGISRPSGVFPGNKGINHSDKTSALSKRGTAAMYSGEENTHIVALIEGEERNNQEKSGRNT